MKSKINLGGKIVTLKMNDIDPEVDIDTLTSIDYSNLYGEAVTVSALMNRWGLIKAEAEKIHQESIINRRQYRAEIRSNFRKDAQSNKEKLFTDPLGNKVKMGVDSVNDAVLLDKEYQQKQEDEIEAKKDLSYIESIYWAIQSKDKKLNSIQKSVTPEEFTKELIEGSVNGMTINKNSLKYS